MNRPDSNLNNCASRGRLVLCKLLILRGANVNATRWGGWRNTTPLLEAVLGNHLEVVQFLLQRGADVNWTDPQIQRTILSQFASSRVVESTRAIALALLDNGAMGHIDHQDDLGRTALLFAASSRNLVLACILLDRGCAVNTRANDGMTALGIANLRIQEGGVTWDEDDEEINPFPATGQSTVQQELREMSALLKLAGGQE